MTDKSGEHPKAPLNPELKKRHDEIYNTDHSAAPLDTTHAHEGKQGEGWPLVWLVVMLLSVLLAIYLLV